MNLYVNEFSFCSLWPSVLVLFSIMCKPSVFEPSPLAHRFYPAHLYPAHLYPAHLYPAHLYPAHLYPAHLYPADIDPAHKHMYPEHETFFQAEVGEGQVSLVTRQTYVINKNVALAIYL